MKKYAIITSIFMFLACTNDAQSLEKIWELEGMETPESVLYDAKGSKMYVANMGLNKDVWAKDGDGYITTIDSTGKVIKKDFTTGLNAPKGMALLKGNLYVADIDEIVVINARNGKILKKITIPGSQTLNDVRALADGTLYVTDSKGRTLYKIIEEQISVVLDSTQLKRPNGVFARGKNLFILDNNAMNSVVDGKLTMDVSGITGGADGIETIGKGEYIISCWSGLIFHVNAKTKVATKMLDTSAEKVNAADLGMNERAKIIYIPTFWDNKIVAYQYKP